MSPTETKALDADSGEIITIIEVPPVAQRVTILPPNPRFADARKVAWNDFWAEFDRMPEAIRGEIEYRTQMAVAEICENYPDHGFGTSDRNCVQVDEIGYALKYGIVAPGRMVYENEVLRDEALAEIARFERMQSWGE